MSFKMLIALMFLVVSFSTQSFAMTQQEKKFEAALLMTEILAFPQYTAEYCQKTLTPKQNKEFTVLVRNWNLRHSAEFMYSTLVIYDLTNVRSLETALHQILFKMIETQRNELKQNMKEYCNEQLQGYKEVQYLTLTEIIDLDPDEESRKYKYDAHKLLYGKKK